MVIIALIVITIFIGWCGYQFYQFDNSKFVKEHPHSLIETVSDQKLQAIKVLYDGIEQQQINAKIILNVQVKESEHYHFADAIILHPAGIFMVSLQQKQGWITGSDQVYEWVEQLHNDEENRFINPTHLMRRMGSLISTNIPEIEKGPFRFVIFFSNDCVFQHVEIHHPAIEVLKYKEIKSWAKSLEGNHLSQEQIEIAYERLKRFGK